MVKLTVTIALDDKGNAVLVLGPDKCIVLDGPITDPDAHRETLRAIDSNGGRIGKGKTAVKIVEATTVHSTKGILKRRKF